MCSTPKSSASTFSRRKTRNACQPEDYKAYAQMLRNASACYERNQELKEARRLAENESKQDETDDIKNKASSHPEKEIKVISLFDRMVDYGSM